LFINRAHSVLTGSGTTTGNLLTGRALVVNNAIASYLAAAANSASFNNGFGLVLEGTGNKDFGTAMSPC